MREIGLNARVEVARGGDPRLSVFVDGKTGVAVGFGDIPLEGYGSTVPGVQVRFDDRSWGTKWLPRWSVQPLPEAPRERWKRKIRNFAKEVLG